MRHGTRYVVLLILLFSTFGIPLAAQAASPSDSTAQRYIVTLAPGSDNVRGYFAQWLAHSIGFRVDQSFDSVIKGFTANLTSGQVNSLRSSSQVMSIQRDLPTHMTDTDQTTPTGVQRIGDLLNSTADIDGSGPDLNINVATLDSGIGPSSDLNVKGGFNALNVSSGGTPNPQDCSAPTSDPASYADDNGHGTHVAGTIAAKDNGEGVVGVAPGAGLYAVKVFDDKGNGYVSYIICGMDWIAANAQADSIKAVNFSGAWSGTASPGCGNPWYSWSQWWLGTQTDPAHQAICNLVNTLGIPMIVAAGNDGKDAKNTLPAAYPEVITVGAIVDTNGVGGTPVGSTTWGTDEARASFSNFGPAVTVYAPGVNILSDWPLGNHNDGADGVSGLNVISGTSMATPHVTGAALLYLLNHPGASPDTIKAALVANGEAGNWGNPSGSQPLLNVGNAAFGPVAPVHNMTVDSVAAPNPAFTGGNNTVTVTITNRGNGTELNASVTLKDGSTTVGTQSGLTLTTNESKTLTFSNWSPTVTGNHTLTATLTYNGGATATNSTTVTVNDVVHDVDVTSVTPAAAPPTDGVATTVTVHVVNNGNQSESGVTVKLTDNGSPVGSTQSVTGTLALGGGADVSFAWTPSINGNPHTLKATVTFNTTGTNSLSTTPITVASKPLGQDIWVTQLSGPSLFGSTGSVTIGSGSGAVAGATVNLSITGPSTNTTRTVVTSSSGTASFSFSAPKWGTYTATVTSVTHNADTYNASKNTKTSVSFFGF
jgi:subtilisin family serine protease